MGYEPYQAGQEDEREKIAEYLEALSESWLEAASKAYMARRHKRRRECADKSLALSEAVRAIRDGAHTREANE